MVTSYGVSTSTFIIIRNMWEKRFRPTLLVLSVLSILTLTRLFCLGRTIAYTTGLLVYLKLLDSNPAPLSTDIISDSPHLSVHQLELLSLSDAARLPVQTSFSHQAGKGTQSRHRSTFCCISQWFSSMFKFAIRCC